MLYRLCRCGAIIPQGTEMCPRCEAQHRSRHMVYNKQCRDRQSVHFYVSKEWLRIRSVLLLIYDGVDIWSLFMEKTIKPAEEVHHIEELDEAWDRRLDPYNLIPLSHDTHTKITALYKAGEESKKRTQKQLLELQKKYFEDRGGLQKVCERLGLVAPSSSVEKTPHENARKGGQ